MIHYDPHGKQRTESEGESPFVPNQFSRLVGHFIDLADIAVLSQNHFNQQCFLKTDVTATGTSPVSQCVISHCIY